MRTMWTASILLRTFGSLSFLNARYRSPLVFTMHRLGGFDQYSFRSDVFFLQELCLVTIGESQTPSFSQLSNRMSGLDVSADQSEVVTISDRKHSKILAIDATGLKRHNRGEWMRAK